MMVVAVVYVYDDLTTMAVNSTQLHNTLSANKQELLKRQGQWEDKNVILKQGRT